MPTVLLELGKDSTLQEGRRKGAAQDVPLDSQARLLRPIDVDNTSFDRLAALLGKFDNAASRNWG